MFWTVWKIAHKRLPGAWRKCHRLSRRFVPLNQLRNTPFTRFFRSWQNQYDERRASWAEELAH